MIDLQIETGAIRVNGASVRAQSDDVICVEFDLRAKYAEVLCVSYSEDETPSIHLASDETTMHADEGGDTIISFPDHAGWMIFGWPSVARYTLSVTMIRMRACARGDLSAQ